LFGKGAVVYEFKLPDLGEGIAEGEILKWHVAVGDTVVEDEPLVDIETDKAAVTIPSPKGGKVTMHAGVEGDVVNVGDVVAVIDDGSGPAVAAPPPPEVAEAPSAPAVVAPVTPPTEPAAPTPETVEVAEPTEPPRKTRPVPATPATRRLAREMKVLINNVPPTGPGGRVTPDDVRRFVEGLATPPRAPAPPPPPGHVKAKEVSDEMSFAEFAAHASATIPFLEVEPLPDFSQDGPVEVEKLRSIRRKVARKMVTSMALVPHVAHMDEADVTELDAFRKREKGRREGGPGEKLTLMAFVMKGVAAGLKAAPQLNASLDPFKEEIVYKKYYNIGFAADTGRGLVVPVVPDADRKSIISLSDEIAEKAIAAREGTLDAASMRGGTFTITNIGALGGSAILPTINYPEVAILAMGQVQEKPVVRDGEIVIRKMLPLTLAFDHRIADGADAARFVSELVRQLSDPNLLLLET
jgi:pyruvate dehydrogenase E2 component (dihydrolipoamide acetyltransferase)